MSDHLAQLERAGIHHPFLDQRQIPPEGAELWGIFWELASGRSGNGFGLNPISFVEIDTWARLNLIVLAPWEVAALKHMDMAFLRAMNEDKSSGG